MFNQQIVTLFKNIKQTGGFIYTKIKTDIKRRPLLNFLLSLLLLLFLIIAVHYITTPKVENLSKTQQTIAVNVYHIGTSPMLSLPAKIVKSGIITIVAQTSGIVHSIPLTEGDIVEKGGRLLNISSDYQGDDAAGIQAQIVQKQYDNTQSTFSLQQDLINNQRDVATISSQNTEQLRQISQQSNNDTNNLISLNQDILNSLSANINSLSSTDVNGSNKAAILQTKELESQFQSGLNQLQSAARQVNYQSNTNNPPTLLANLQKDITLKQLDLQSKALELNKEVSGLQLNLAYVNDSLMHPSSPVRSRVERVHVTEGQSVTPGTVLLTLSALDPDVTAVVSVPNQIATIVSQLASSTLHLGKKIVTLMPRYVSKEATDGSLYTILFSIPSDYQVDVSNTGFVTADIPLALPDTSDAVPFIPIDAVYQSQSDSFVYVIMHEKVISKNVTLGDVYGKYVQIISGLSKGDDVILDRNIMSGDLVTEKK